MPLQLQKMVGLCDWGKHLYSQERSVSMLRYCKNCNKNIPDIENWLCAHCGVHNDNEKQEAECSIYDPTTERRRFLKKWIYVNIGLFLSIPLSVNILGSTSYGAAILGGLLIFIFIISLATMAIYALVIYIYKQRSVHK